MEDHSASIVELCLDKENQLMTIANDKNIMVKHIQQNSVAKLGKTYLKSKINCAHLLNDQSLLVAGYKFLQKLSLPQLKLNKAFHLDSSNEVILKIAADNTDSLLALVTSDKTIKVYWLNSY